jgi:uncharacterized membrane protein YbhN (UPF0104 family)
LVIGAAVVFIWRQAGQSGFDAGLFLQTLTALEWGWLAAMIGAVAGTYYLRALRWAVFIEPLRSTRNIWALTKCTVIGFTAITILGRPGEFVRPYLIARAERVSVSSQLAALVLERVYDLLAVLLLFGIGLSRLERSGVQVGARLHWVLHTGGQVVAVLAVACLAVLVVSRYYMDSFKGLGMWLTGFLPPRLRSRSEELVNSFLHGMESTRSVGAVMRILGFTAAEWILILLVNLFVFQAFSGFLRLGALDVVIFTGFLAFGAVVQIPGVGGGVQVVSILVLTELFQAPLEVATSIALMIWFASFLLVVPAGLIFAVREGLEWKSLRRVEEEVK